MTLDLSWFIWIIWDLWDLLRKCAIGHGAVLYEHLRK